MKKAKCQIKYVIFYFLHPLFHSSPLVNFPKLPRHHKLPGTLFFFFKKKCQISGQMDLEVPVLTESES